MGEFERADLSQMRIAVKLRIYLNSYLGFHAEKENEEYESGMKRAEKCCEINVHSSVI